MLTIVDESSLTRNVLEKWKSIAKEFTAATERSNNIKNARTIFEDMSKAVFKLQSSFGHAGGQYYQMYCPMAFDFKGAFWMQRKKSLVNPYFGAEMLKCGKKIKIFDPEGGNK